MLFGCEKNENKNPNKHSVLKTEAVKQTKVEAESKVSKIIEDCIFDQATQTDDFLKGIKELEGYTWDDEAKTAEIILNDHWFLSITRGGCDSFSMSMDFLYDRALNFDENKEMIFNQIIWGTNLLNNEFNSDLIKETIVEGKITITKEEDFIYVHFMNPEIYELYNFKFSSINEVTNFNISYHID